jgi:endonuclease YncB( thermonuclease family)
MQVCTGKRAFRKGALFAFWLLLFSPWAAAWADTCEHPPANESVTVKYVHDGDTINLSDGRKLRLIGINTPELARDRRPAEPYAEEAKRRVMHYVPRHSRVEIIYGRERHDRYGRLLVHVILPDGRNLNRLLLHEGLAQAIVMPPNTRLLECYLDEERSARARHQGLWQLAYFQPLRAAALSGREQGFHLLRGKVRHVGESRKSWWLDLDGPVSVRIAKHDLAYFPDTDFRALLGRRIEVRGWLHRYRAKLMMGIRHKKALRVLH